MMIIMVIIIIIIIIIITIMINRILNNYDRNCYCDIFDNGDDSACTGPMTQHRSLCLKHQNSEYCNSERLGSARNNSGYSV